MLPGDISSPKTESESSPCHQGHQALQQDGLTALVRGARLCVPGVAEEAFPVPQGLEIKLVIKVTPLSGAEPTKAQAPGGMDFLTKSQNALFISYNFKLQAQNKTKQ